MPVYVDPLLRFGPSATFPFDRSCHLFADTLDELHAFAAGIGMRREWFQNGRIPHYDLNEERRRVAVAKGAIELDRRAAVRKWRAMRGEATG